MKQLLKSKRAFAGVFILTFYIAFAIAAPYLTHYDPINGINLSGHFDPPTWWSALPGQPDLSRNMQLFPNTGFDSPSSLQDQGWSVTQTPSGLSYFSTGYDPNEKVVRSYNGSSVTFPVREQIDYVRVAGSPLPPSSGATITIAKNFLWQYSGPPFRFIGSLRLLLTGIDNISSMGVTVFIAKEGVPVPIYTGTLDAQSVDNLVDLGGAFALDSQSSTVKQLFPSAADPARFVFFGKGAYTYGLQLTVVDQNVSQGASVRLFIDNANLNLYGTSWGLLGTDQLGRDIFTQLAWGARVSLIVGLLASVVAIAIGLTVGLLAGYLGKIVDEVLMRSTDLLLVLPGLPLLIILAALLGPSIWNIIAIIAVLSWPGFARIIRSQVLTLKERTFIEASRAAGSGVGHIVRKHIVPNVMGLTYVNLALTVPAAIVTEAALAFLGLRDPSVYSWGAMLNDIQLNQTQVTDWWWILPPGLSIALLSLSFILIGYALDEILNPRLRMRR